MEVAVCRSDRGHSRGDFVPYLVKGIPVTLPTDRRFQSPTAGVTHDDHERSVQVLYGVFHGANLGAAAYIAGVADDEDVSDAPVEHELNGHPRIGTRYDGCNRMLAIVGGLSAAGGIEVGLGEGAVEVFVAETSVNVA